MLTIEHLTKHYPGTQKGITDLTLHIKPGDLCAFVGPNGAGKTTTLKAIAGIHPFDRGEIFIDGISLRQDPMECKRRLAYLPDNPDLYNWLTGMQYLSFIAGVFGLPSRDLWDRIRGLSDPFGITDSLGDLIGSYSHGMKQKLALVSALLHEPRLLILDEPFVGLDPEAVYVMKARMHDICNGGGAVFFSTHVLEVAQRLCNQAAIIKDGSLVAAGPMEKLLKDKDSLESLFMEVAAHEPH